MNQYKLLLSKRAQKFIQVTDTKHAKQLKTKLLTLLTDPYPQDSKKLIGYDYYRVDCGEYRIIYRTEEDKIIIALIGKRNDSDVYKKLTRLINK